MSLAFLFDDQKEEIYRDLLTTEIESGGFPNTHVCANHLK